MLDEWEVHLYTINRFPLSLCMVYSSSSRSWRTGNLTRSVSLHGAHVKLPASHLMHEESTEDVHGVANERRRPCPMGWVPRLLSSPFSTPSFWSSKIFGAGNKKFLKDMQVLLVQRAISHMSQEPRPRNGEGRTMGVEKVVLCSQGPSNIVWSEVDHVAGPLHILLAEKGRIWFNIICFKFYLVVFVCRGIYPEICREIWLVGKKY